MTNELNRDSSKLTQKKMPGFAQTFLYGAGFTEADMCKAQVGIGSVWFEGSPCNMHLLELSQVVKEGVTAAGLKGMQFNTIGVSDGIPNGTSGMSYSLPSRDIIADSLETIMSAHFYDACIAIPGCDKNLPGCIIGIGRVNRPSLVIFGGSRQKACIGTRIIDPSDFIRAFAERETGKISEIQYKEIIQHACPGAGACDGMYTANTIACAIEVMGMSLPYSSSTPATGEEKRKECLEAGSAIRILLEKNIKPKDIMTTAAFRDAIVTIMVLGGSTNAVIHLIAMAQAVNIKLSIEDFQKIADITPVLGDFKPSGKNYMTDLHEVGGTPAVLKMLLKEKLIDGTRLTVTGKTLEENLENLPGLKSGQTVLRPLDNPFKKTGHLRILKGSLAPEGAVAKITGKEGVFFKGPAKIFDSEELMLEAMQKKNITKGDVIVIRYEGPKGGPGMPEMLLPTLTVHSSGLSKDVALITDGRFSGVSSGFIIGHICPEAQEGGPIALIKDGDIIIIDAENNTINVELTEQEFAKRKSEWKMPPYKVKGGVLARFINDVSSASTGCITDGITNITE